MTQAERRMFLIKQLLLENPEYKLQIPESEKQQKQLLRSLFNIRMPKPLSQQFLEVQDAYLKQEIKNKGITDYRDLTPVEKGIYLWQGDITTLKCDAIVNAANSSMLGCFVPCHGCIDNAIHTYAGAQLRYACMKLISKQQNNLPCGSAKITPAFNLPCKFVLHTVGPIVSGKPTEKDKSMLALCYRSCLDLALHNSLKSIAFCCISTGEFCFPSDMAAKIAVSTVKEYLNSSKIEVIFNVFKDIDYKLYRDFLG